MNTLKIMKIRSFGLVCTLLCIWSLPNLAGAGTVPPIPSGPFDANGNPSVPDYYTTANWANSPPLAKFVDSLPGLGSAKANNLGQYLSVAKPDITTYPGSDYYEIELVQFNERMHSDLPAPGTMLRGYVQVNRGTNISAGTLPSQNLCGANRHACTPADTAAGVGLAPDPVHQAGPTIIAERDRPIRIKFTNKLPVGVDGNLFIPVDTTVMGAGPGPAYAGTTRGDGAPCDNTQDPNNCASYPQNRAVIHLHGGRTPWISDGTPHQWITPADEITPFTKGVSFKNVPDMPDPGDGSMTYYYTNQQSSRLMFYHDHAWGITRLNVYVGEAAGYLITDKYDQDLVARGIVPPDQIPLIIQDKTFVDATPVNHPVTGAPTTQIRVTDPLWNWGSGTPDVNGVRPPVTGDLWLPHVYMPAQTLAAGFGGVNPFGRWMYGPWFYPATVVTKGPVANPYYDADCSSPLPAVYANCTTPGQPTMIPGTPNTSMGMEAFQDSAIVNGTAFPTLTVDPRAYRFRILNAASDRFFNLSFYKADPNQVSPDFRPADRHTEVAMVTASASLAAASNWPPLWPVDGRDGGVPDPGTCTNSGTTANPSWNCTNWGPKWIQIGTDSGFLPKPVVIDPQPITYITDPTAFWVGNVDKMGLAVGPAERADVIVDFSAYAGQTLILYNDAPAAWPAGVATYDYYTDAPDQRDVGGYGTGGTYDLASGTWIGGTGPKAGYAPNTRTVMQVIVRSSVGTDPAYTFSQANLEKEFTSAAPVTAVNPAPAKTLFERSQEPIIVGQAAYKDAYPNSYFPTNYPWEGINQINDHFLQFVTLAGEPVKIPTEPKGLHDEMGASFDPIYGRMSGNLAMQIPNPTTLTANLILYGFSDIPTEVVDNSTQINVSVIPDPVTGYNTTADGTQIWKISHNGVDTHPIHFHIFDVQLINRVGWDGQILLPEPNELGWKEVVKISPLEDTIVAVRPRAPALPFGVPNSLRPLNPGIPIDSPMGFNSVDWTTGAARVPAVTNQLFNFGWEYVWHCHILSHEEMDMMRPIVLNVQSIVPDAPYIASAALSGSNVNLTWIDPTSIVDVTTFGNPKNEIGFRIERADIGGDFAPVGTALANATTFTDTTSALAASYRYRVVAYNAAGETPSAEFALIPSITMAPAVANFGNVAVSYTSIPAVFTIGNTGQAYLTVTGLTAGGTDAGMFQLLAGSCGALPFNVAPGGNCNFSATFTPSSAGSKTANVQIASNSTVQTLNLSGAGVTGTFPVQIGTQGYGALATSSIAAVAGNTIQAWGILFTEPLVNFNVAGRVSLTGGWDPAFSSNTGGKTYLKGTLTITQGTLVVDKLTVY